MFTVEHVQKNTNTIQNYIAPTEYLHRITELEYKVVMSLELLVVVFLFVCFWYMSIQVGDGSWQETVSVVLCPCFNTSVTPFSDGSSLKSWQQGFEVSLMNLCACWGSRKSRCLSEGAQGSQHLLCCFHGVHGDLRCVCGIWCHVVVWTTDCECLGVLFACLFVCLCSPVHESNSGWADRSHRYRDSTGGGSAHSLVVSQCSVCRWRKGGGQSGVCWSESPWSRCMWDVGDPGCPVCGSRYPGWLF